MATTTPNYGWAVPTSTDLVKDGATAIETLGDAIDASMNTALGTKKAGMVLLNTTSFSGVASVSLPASTFTSTYTNYRILFQNLLASGSANPTLRLRAAGSDNSTSNYDSETIYAQSTAAYGNGVTNGSSFPLGVGATQRMILSLDVFNPQTADDTYISGICYMTTNDSGNYISFGGRFDGSTSFDSATFIAGGANVITGQVQVYGYAK